MCTYNFSIVSNTFVSYCIRVYNTVNSCKEMDTIEEEENFTTLPELKIAALCQMG